MPEGVNDPYVMGALFFGALAVLGLLYVLIERYTDWWERLGVRLFGDDPLECSDPECQLPAEHHGPHLVGTTYCELHLRKREGG